jgi:hypothetical protein
MLEGFEYYYNNVPGDGPCRNNLIYTSLINENKDRFVQWYYNDSDYHMGYNQVLDQSLMRIKWEREKGYFGIMKGQYPQHVPELEDIDDSKQLMILKVQGPDFWEQSFQYCPEGVVPTDPEFVSCYDKVLPDWQDQMLEIIQAHKDLGIYKYSMHPSSYFVVDGKLKSINYFFCYDVNDKPITVREHLSHISQDRQAELFPKMESIGITLDQEIGFLEAQNLCFESFSNNYPREFIDKAKAIYNS